MVGRSLVVGIVMTTLYGGVPQLARPQQDVVSISRDHKIVWWSTTLTSTTGCGLSFLRPQQIVVRTTSIPNRMIVPSYIAMSSSRYLRENFCRSEVNKKGTEETDRRQKNLCLVERLSNSFLPDLLYISVENNHMDRNSNG